MENSKVFETWVNSWQKAVRYIFKNLQEFYKWSYEKVWLEVKNEMLKNSEGKIGSYDLDGIQAILTLKKILLYLKPKECAKGLRTKYLY